MWIQIVTIVLLFSVTLIAKPGDLDLSFGGDGIVTTEVGISNSEAYSITVQSDGKIVTAGYSNNCSNDNVTLVRYSPDGSLDTSFDSDGIVTTIVGNGDSYADGIAIQSDGKIVIAGIGHNGSDYDFALVRYNPDGSLDTSFDDDGIVMTAIGYAFDKARSITIQSDRKIVAAGYSNNGTNTDFALVRYNPDGSLDTSFDNDGIVTTAIGSSGDNAYSVVIQNDDKIVVVGHSTNMGFALVRYNPDGSLDTSFDNDGIVTTEVGSGSDGAYNVTIQNDGKIVVAGSSFSASSKDFTLVRYNPDGSLDTSFDNDGIVTTEIRGISDAARSITIQSNGKIVVAGYSNNGSNYDFAMVRYNPNGSLDTSFGSGGITTTEIGSIDSKALGMVIQSDGKIISAGYNNNGSNDDFALVRYEGDPMVLSPIYYLLQ